MIAEAMNRGLIAVEYSNKTVEMGELIRSGIFKTWNKKEVISYVILNIKHPETGRNVSVADALSSGLIDQEQGRFGTDCLPFLSYCFIVIIVIYCRYYIALTILFY